HGCSSTRAHTPIVSKAQQGKFGAEYGRRKAGGKGSMKGITTAELRSHLKESKGKKLPRYSTSPGAALMRRKT
ncbi:MAG TPA: hypothetical protein VM219_01295, partial [Phycisphaerae bacterium]|nr:hypothetical protein [Phycisphaerae bacterium]